MSRPRRPFPSDKPFVYLTGRAQPGAPWTGSYKDGYRGTALTPAEKVTYVDDISSGRRKVPVLLEHDAHDEIGQRLPKDAIIGETIGAFHDGPGNIFQVVQLPTSKVETYRIWDDLEYGKKLGFSLRTDLRRLGPSPTAPVIGLGPTHIAITSTPDWATADKPPLDPHEHQSPNFDTGTWIYHWTDEPVELRSHLKQQYMEPAKEHLFTRIPPSLLRRVDELATERGAPRQSEPAVEIRYPLVVSDATVASAGRAAESTGEKKNHSSSSSATTMASTEQQQPSAVVASQPPQPSATPPTSAQAIATETKAPVSITPDRMMSEIKSRLDEYNSETSAGRKLDKNEDLAAYVYECIKQVKDMRTLSQLFPVVKQLADEREASVSAVPEWINMLRQSGIIVPDTAAFALQAEKNAHTEDGRLWRDLVVAAAGKAKSQREIEMQQLRSLDNERTEKESLKRKFDDSQLELTEEKAKRVKAEESLAKISPEMYAAARNPSGATQTTASQPVVADAVTASARGTNGAMSFGGAAGDMTKATRLWAQIAQRPGRGQMTPPPKLTKEQAELLSARDVESMGSLTELRKH